MTPDRSLNADLADLLEKVAINNELVVAVADNNVTAALQIWFENIKRTGFTNYMVVALDDDIAAFCKENEVPVHRRDAEISVAQQGMGSSSSKVSGLKFLILREFLVLGYSILLSDVDIVYLQNPFDHLYRDCNLESTTDGFDNGTTMKSPMTRSWDGLAMLTPCESSCTIQGSSISAQPCLLLSSWTG